MGRNYEMRESYEREYVAGACGLAERPLRGGGDDAWLGNLAFLPREAAGDGSEILPELALSGASLFTRYASRDAPPLKRRWPLDEVDAPFGPGQPAVKSTPLWSGRTRGMWNGPLFWPSSL